MRLLRVRLSAKAGEAIEWMAGVVAPLWSRERACEALGLDVAGLAAGFGQATMLDIQSSDFR